MNYLKIIQVSYLDKNLKFIFYKLGFYFVVFFFYVYENTFFEQPAHIILSVMFSNFTIPLCH